MCLFVCLRRVITTKNDIEKIRLLGKCGFSGIGEEIVRQFAQCNAQVAITGHEETNVLKVVNEIEQITGTKPISLVVNLADDAFAEKLVRETMEKYGQIDVLVNNAGRLCVDGLFRDPNLMDKYELLMNLNVRSVFKMTHLAVPYLEKTKGSIMNTSSIAGFLPCVNAVYSVTNAALAMITKCSALDLGEKGIRVNSICPGVIRTPIGASMGQPNAWIDENNPLLKHTIFKTLGEPRDVANMVLFLSSEDASYMTGGHYFIDGGYMCL